MSSRGSGSSPSIISQLAYAGVSAPSVPGSNSVIDPDTLSERLAAREMPKSNTFTVPSRVMYALAGLKSECTMPCSCAYASARAMCAVYLSAVFGGRPPASLRLISLSSGSPSSSSMTMKTFAPSRSNW